MTKQSADLCGREPEQTSEMFSLCGRQISLFSKSSFQFVGLRLTEQNSTLLLASAHRRRWWWRLLLLLMMRMKKMLRVCGADELVAVAIAGRLRLPVDAIVCRVCIVNLCRLRADICNRTPDHQRQDLIHASSSSLSQNFYHSSHITIKLYNMGRLHRRALLYTTQRCTCT